MKSLIPKAFKIINDIFTKAVIAYDEATNTIIIQNSNDPLNIVFEGDVKLGIDGNFEIQSDGQIDIISHGKKICIETLNSQLFFNSRRAKYCDTVANRYADVSKQIVDPKPNHAYEYERTSYEALYDKLCELEMRLAKYEHNQIEE